MRPGYRRLVRFSNVRLLNNSEAGARDYARWLRQRRRSITVIRNGIDITEIRSPTPQDIAAYRRKVGLPPGSIVVGGIFRLGEEKRPILWAKIAAAVACKRSDVRFLVIGEGPLQTEVKTLAEREGFSDRLLMPGPETNSALPLALMTCLMLTSRVEGLPNVLLEAQAVGIPVVTSRVGGAPEATDHGLCGWVVDGDDPAPYVDRILAVLGDARWRTAAGRAGPALMLHRFGMDRMISETLEVYGSPTDPGTRGGQPKEPPL
jgi:glycosyltransferase involved in cell wall biosynthesis